MSHSIVRLAPVLVAVLTATACQEGGTEKNATSEVKLQVDHHMAGFGGLVQFKEGFPLKEDGRYSDAATLHFKDDGNYFLTRPGQSASGEEKYVLEKSGVLTITIRRKGQSALRWPGFYDLSGDGYIFVSRDADFLRVFAGVRQIPGIPQLEGKWWIFGETLVFADSSIKPAPEHVGRAFDGSITFDKDGKITSGNWKNSAGGTVNVGGSARVGKLGSTDLSLSLTAGFAQGRSFSGGIAKHVGVLIDDVPTAGKNDEKNVGLCYLVRQQTVGLDIKRMSGKWRICVHAIFNSPGRSGCDVALGTLELATDKTWSLEMLGLKYTGTYGVGTNGELLLTEKSFNQAWSGAIDADYRTIVLVDRTLERSPNPWVGSFFGIREDQ